jgi:hypothetical protein
MTISPSHSSQCRSPTVTFPTQTAFYWQKLLFHQSTTKRIFTSSRWKRKNTFNRTSHQANSLDSIKHEITKANWEFSTWYFSTYCWIFSNNFPRHTIKEHTNAFLFCFFFLTARGEKSFERTKSRKIFSWSRKIKQISDFETAFRSFCFVFCFFGFRSAA